MSTSIPIEWDLKNDEIIIFKILCFHGCIEGFILLRLKDGIINDSVPNIFGSISNVDASSRVIRVEKGLESEYHPSTELLDPALWIIKISITFIELPKLAIAFD